MNDYSQLEKRLNYTFKDKQLIIEALTHKSYKKPYNNERLEFLGDAVLDLIVGEYLFNKFPNSNEGFLSKIRASLVNESGFTLLAQTIDLGSYIFLSPAEENNNGRKKPSLLSNAFEAIVGAIYLEGGLQAAKKIAVALLEEAYPQIDLQSLSKDYKTALQELTQATHGVTPSYELLSSCGPDHKKEFEIAVILDNITIATAKGKSKKEATAKSGTDCTGDTKKMNTFGKKLTLTTFGESHGKAIGCILDGLPAGLPIDEAFVQSELDRRKPGKSPLETGRKEEDRVEILSGVFEGLSTGTPIAMIIYNTDQKSADYNSIKDLFRPGHADFTYFHKYGVRDYRGGGRSSARETAARVAGGAVAKLMLQELGIRIQSGLCEVDGIKSNVHDFDYARTSKLYALDPAMEKSARSRYFECKKQP